MRVLFLSGDSPDVPDQGDRIRAHYLLREMSGRHDVFLLTAGERPPNAVSAVISSCAAAVHIPISRREMMLGAVRHPMLPATVAARYQRSVTEAVRMMVDRHKIDLIYAYQHRMVPHAWRLDGVRLVADLTDSLWLYRCRMAVVASPLRRPYHRLEAMKLRRFETAVLRRSDVTLVASPDDAAVLRPLSNGAQLCVVPNGVDTDAFRGIGPVPADPVLIFVGHMGYPPNVDGLLAFYREAFPAIVRQVPRVRLLVVGKDPVPAILALAADPHVVVTGTVPDVRPYLEQAAVAICPIRFGSGTRLKILEAMAAGRPVVSTFVGCEGLDVEPGRHLDVVSRPADMAGPIIRLLEDETRRDALAGAGLNLVKERYDWSRIGAEVADTIEQWCGEQEAKGSDQPAKERT